jgi:hypothetical protein
MISMRDPGRKLVQAADLLVESEKNGGKYGPPRTEVLREALAIGLRLMSDGRSCHPHILDLLADR